LLPVNILLSTFFPEDASSQVYMVHASVLTTFQTLYTFLLILVYQGFLSILSLVYHISVYIFLILSCRQHCPCPP